MSDAFTSLIAVFESANYDVTKLAQDPAALAKLESFSGQEVQDASTRIEAYFSAGVRHQHDRHHRLIAA